jgi:hypothetical protein
MTRCSKHLITAAVFALVTPVLAQAQATRTWVSGVGDDVNPCSRTAPCKTFAGAISKTAAGGEISALDPAGFGGLTVTKSITVNGDGTLAGQLVSSATGVIINAGANDLVIIRNISINGGFNPANGLGGAINGIRYLAGKSVLVENVTITGLASGNGTSSGVGINADVSTANASLIVRDTSIKGSFLNTVGIRASTNGGGTLKVSVNNVSVVNANKGINVLTIGAKAVVTDSTFATNVTGVHAEGNGTIDLLNSTVSGNTTAVNASGGGLARISGNRVFENTTEFSCSVGGAIETGQNNTTAGNGAGACVLGTTQVVLK